jgi:hypothetical protein
MLLPVNCESVPHAPASVGSVRVADPNASLGSYAVISYATM